MLKTRKNSVLSIVIVFFLIINYFLLHFSFKEKNVITNYIREYYNEFLDDRQNISSSYTNFNEYYLDKYEEYLTRDLEEKLIESGEMPNIDLLNYGRENKIKSIDLNNIIFTKRDKNIYEVKYDLVLKDNEKKIKLINKEEIYYLKKENNKFKINYIKKL